MKVSEGIGKISSVANMIAGFLLFPGVEELDFTGPWGDVFHLEYICERTRKMLERW